MHRALGCIARLMCLLFTLHGYFFFCGDSISDSVVVVVVVVVVAATTTHARMIVCDGHLVSD